LKEHVGGTHWELREHVENMIGTQWVQQKSRKGDEFTSKGRICQF